MKAFLSTVLGGLPSGSIMLARNEHLDLSLRPLEGAPKLKSTPEHGPLYALLDGQQRLTSLFQALTDSGPDEYFVNFAMLAEGASVLDDDVMVAKGRNNRLTGRINPDDLAPIRALIDEHSFFNWWNRTLSTQPRARSWDVLYGQKLNSIRDYELPITELSGKLELETVAQIFERTNKWGQRLDAFDLLVARLQQGGWNLRNAWDDAQLQFPAIGRVFGNDGLTTISAIALLLHGDVRRTSVLRLRTKDIVESWDEACESTDHIAKLLLHEGARKPELVAYSSVTIAMIAASMRQIPDEQLIAYYWLSASNRWHEAAANTRVVSDYRALTNRSLPPELPRDLPPTEDFFTNTRRSSRALWGAMLSAMLTREPRDLATGLPVTSSDPSRVDNWQLVPIVKGGAEAETSTTVPSRLRTSAQLFALEGGALRLKRLGFLEVVAEHRQQQALFSDWNLPALLSSQLLPEALAHSGPAEGPQELLKERAFDIRRLIRSRIGDISRFSG